jgi:DNA-binding HxlR family transcriptional regulator
MLIQQLRALEADGIVARTVYAQMPPKVEYRLTERGIALAPVFSSLLEWASMYPHPRKEITPGGNQPPHGMG